MLEFAFALGVWMAAGRACGRRITAGLLFALWVVGLVAYFFPIQQRAALSTAGPTLTDTMHLILWGAVTSLMILLMIEFGATTDGKWFRVYGTDRPS